METSSVTSNALVRKRPNTDLMLPTPQLERIKRPKVVLDEEDYTESLSKVIARDFFPDLAAMEAQREYLDALASKDKLWISSADSQLRDVMTPGRRAPSPAPSTAFGGHTPSVHMGFQTPGSISTFAEMATKNTRVHTSMSLGKFQATYTSEDNESFYKLMDKQNQKKADKNSWMWNENKLPSKRMLKEKEIRERRALEGLPAIEDKSDHDRPARPDSWKAEPRNGLMFVPHGVDDKYPNPSLRSAAEKQVVYENTRMPRPVLPPRPPSPTLSEIKDAVHGRVRPQFRTQSEVEAGDETPRVNGYAFVDDEDDEPEAVAALPPPIDLGPGDATPNPFKLQETRKREGIHHKLVARIAESKREASGNGLTGKDQRTPVPKFPSSPRISGGLTPAAQRLLHNIGNATPRRSGFESSTPARTPVPRFKTMKKLS